MTPSVEAAHKLAAWLAAGGERAAGLPPGALARLHEALARFEATLGPFPESLSRACEAWRPIAGPTGGAAVGPAIAAFAAALDAAAALGEKLLADAAEARVRAEEAAALLEAHVRQDDARVPALEAAVALSRERAERAEQALRAARAELAGNRGFRNGFLTGLTFGIYNPLKANLRKAQAALDQIHAELQVGSAQLQALVTCQAERRQCAATLEVVGRTGSELAECQGCLNAARVAAQAAARDEARAVAEGRSASTAGYYRERVGGDMARLATWNDAFAIAARRAVA